MQQSLKGLWVLYSVHHRFYCLHSYVPCQNMSTSLDKLEACTEKKWTTNMQAWGRGEECVDQPVISLQWLVRLACLLNADQEAASCNYIHSRNLSVKLGTNFRFFLILGKCRHCFLAGNLARYLSLFDWLIVSRKFALQAQHHTGRAWCFWIVTDFTWSFIHTVPSHCC